MEWALVKFPARRDKSKATMKKGLERGIHDWGTTLGTKDLRTRIICRRLGFLFITKKSCIPLPEGLLALTGPNMPRLTNASRASGSTLIVVPTHFPQLSSLALFQSFPPTFNLKLSSPSSQSPSSLLPSNF